MQELAWLLLLSASPLLALYVSIKLLTLIINALSEYLGTEQRHITTFIILELIGVTLLLERKFMIYTVSFLQIPADLDYQRPFPFL
jgi:hypothetical protein